MGCPHIPRLGHDQFRRKLISKWLAQRVPLAGSMELDLNCNLQCVHCYRDGDWPRRALGTGEVIEILDQMAEAGTLWLLLTGGEIFLRPDFFEIYEHARRSGFLITLFTNATLITEEIADHLAAQPPRKIEVTLYGTTRETYEKVT